MTISASLVGKIGGGHGLTEDILKAVHAELVKGKSPGLIPALVLLQPGPYSTDPSKGNKVDLKFKVVRLEPVTDEADASRIREAISDAYNAREDDGQATLDLGEEAAQRYLAYIEEWRKEQGLTAKDVKTQWAERFAAPESGITLNYKTAAPNHLHEFALAVGAMTDEPVDGTESTDGADGGSEA